MFQRNHYFMRNDFLEVMHLVFDSFSETGRARRAMESTWVPWPVKIDWLSSRLAGLWTRCAHCSTYRTAAVSRIEDTEFYIWIITGKQIPLEPFGPFEACHDNDLASGSHTLCCRMPLLKPPWMSPMLTSSGRRRLSRAQQPNPPSPFRPSIIY